MDPNPIPEAAPAAAGINKVPETVAAVTDTEAKPAESVATSANPFAEKPADEKKDDAPATTENAAVPSAEPEKLKEPSALSPPTDAPAAETSDEPKPASMEEITDKDGPVAITGIDEPKAVPSEQAAAEADSTTVATSDDPATSAATVTDMGPLDAPVEPSVEEPVKQNAVVEPAIEAELTKDTVMEDSVMEDSVIEKPEPVNGAPSRDVQMTGALNEAEPSGSGEREAAPQAIPPEAKASEPETNEPEITEVKVDSKRKADELETNGTNGAAKEAHDEDKPVEKRAKTGRPGRPPGRPATNGAAKETTSSNKEKESLGQKVAKNVKKVLPPVGKTARKTRSQGPV
ncbi:hypothetical protein CTRI78_v002885 [Colletotrichum trifolii]|uniref:Uncharacterized protein n=1 Tax=Colletotrichum trifolii TaxID=5466 RepID=A0A4R8RLP6_COLTR|nr:hypothetical protein CTRI78_v002885 [Colletotrichum trifolii]